MFRRRQPQRYYGATQRKHGLTLGILLILVIGFSTLWLVRSTSWFVSAPDRIVIIPSTSEPLQSTPTHRAIATQLPDIGATASLAAVDQDGLCPPDCAALRQHMLELVNHDRGANGRDPLLLYEPATHAGQAHAEDMLRRQYFDHINPEGEGPDVRLARAQAASAQTWGENIWMFQNGTRNGQAQPIQRWMELVDLAEESWMNSPGHRANLLNPDFTHLGIGMSYDPAQGEVRMVQVFFTPMQ